MVAIVPLVVIALFPEEDAVTAGATFIGMGSGIILERRFLHFGTAGPILARIGRFFVGGALLVGIWWGLRSLLADLEPALLLRLLRYVVVGLWGAYGAPWLFLRIGLARREDLATSNQ
jgi:hypothetical protein